MNPTLRLSLLVVLLCGLVYANALFNGFVYDDWDLVVNSQWLKDGPFLDAFRIGYWESSRPLPALPRAGPHRGVRPGGAVQGTTLTSAL
jgi:hypothetical protein